VFHHVTLHASDLDASTRFYEAVLAKLGFVPGNVLRLAQAPSHDGVTRHLHIGFAARSRADVDAFWQAGVDAGHRDDGAPGPRPQYRDDYYGAFLLDPDGNSAEAVHHAMTPEREEIDHLWMRVPDLEAARSHYLERGLKLGDDTPERVQFGDERGSFSLVEGAPSENVDFEVARTGH
jgi:catechol 2,3-dioxygenase-like lactoylglutathione lyase family enzyme